MHKAVKKRIYFTIFSIIIISVVGGLLIWQLRANLVFFYSPSQVENITDKSKNIWLGGLVKSYNPVEKNGIILHNFVITDNKSIINIEYYGALPNLFKVGQGVVVYGKIINNVLQASRLAVKHDEIYMTKEKYQKLKTTL